MKVLVLLFSLMFSFSILADCCNSFELEDCRTELLQSNDGCDQAGHSSATDDLCHCSFSCSVKILSHKSNDINNSVFKLESNFLKFIQHYKNLDPSPDLHPPIS
jgi:hypothetical protein